MWSWRKIGTALEGTRIYEAMVGRLMLWTSRYFQKLLLATESTVNFEVAEAFYECQETDQETDTQMWHQCEFSSCKIVLLFVNALETKSSGISRPSLTADQTTVLAFS